MSITDLLESLGNVGQPATMPRPLYDGFETRARMELDRHMRRERWHNPRYEMPAKEAERFLRNIEHMLRVDAFRKCIEPFIAQKCRLINLFPSQGHFVRHPDGSFIHEEPEYPEWVRKALAEYDHLIAQAAEQHRLTVEAQ